MIQHRASLIPKNAVGLLKTMMMGNSEVVRHKAILCKCRCPDNTCYKGGGCIGLIQYGISIRMLQI